MTGQLREMDKSQLGRAGELALALYALITSKGEVELYEPVVDDDHVDLVGAIRGGLPTIGVQVKTADALDKSSQVEARASFLRDNVRDDRGICLRGLVARLCAHPHRLVDSKP